jgi:hypothetical protein
MAELTVVYKLPFPSVEVVDSAYWDGRGIQPCVRLEYQRGTGAYSSGIGFSGVVAMRERAERCCTPWHIQAFDLLVEVHNSSWVAEIRSDTDRNWRDHWAMHHYMIYLDSAGCFEVIADNWSLVPEQQLFTTRHGSSEG